MNTRPEDGARPVQVRAGSDGRYSVDARGGMGVQVGEGNTQIVYTYNTLTWTDGVASPPLVSVSGAVDSPYRGLSAFDEQDAASGSRQVVGACPPGGGSAGWAQAWLAGCLDAAHASALTVAAGAVCGGRAIVARG